MHSCVADGENNAEKAENDAYIAENRRIKGIDSSVLIW